MKNWFLGLVGVMVGTCFGMLGDIELPSNGNRIIWPGGAMSFDDDSVSIGTPLTVDNIMTFSADSADARLFTRTSFIFEVEGDNLTWDGSSLTPDGEQDLGIDRNGIPSDPEEFGVGWGSIYLRGAMSWIGPASIDLRQSVSRGRLGGGIWRVTENLFAESDVFVDGDLAVTGIITGANLGSGESLKLLGSSANELLVVAQYINITQQAGPNKYELRLSGTFTGGSNTDYEIEIDGTSPDTFKWRKDTGVGFGAYTPGVAAPLAFTELDAAIQIAFRDSGSDDFVIGDAYSFTADSSPAIILNVDTETPLVTIASLGVTNNADVGGTFTADTVDADHLVVNTSTDFGGVDLDNTGDVIPVNATKILGSVSTAWAEVKLDGTIGITTGITHTLDFNIGTSFDWRMGSSNDVVHNFDGVGAFTGTLTFESDNDKFIFGSDAQIDGDLDVDNIVCETITAGEYFGLSDVHLRESGITFGENDTAEIRLIPVGFMGKPTWTFLSRTPSADVMALEAETILIDCTKDGGTPTLRTLADKNNFSWKETSRDYFSADFTDRELIFGFDVLAEQAELVTRFQNGDPNGSALAVRHLASEVEVDGTFIAGDGTNVAKIEDGDMHFEADAGLHFGEMFYHDGGFDTVLATQDTDFQVLGFDANGESNGSVIPDHTNDHITIGKAGRYLVSYSISCRAAQSNKYEFHIKYNNGASNALCSYTLRHTTVASKIGVSANTCIIDFPADATVELWVRRTTGGAVAKTITIEQVNLNVTQIGGAT